METSAVKPQLAELCCDKGDLTSALPPAYFLTNTDLLAQHLPLPQGFLFLIPSFFAIPLFLS